MNCRPLWRVQSSLVRAASAWLRTRPSTGTDIAEATHWAALGRSHGLPTCSLLFVRNHYYGKKSPKVPPTKPLSFDYGGDLEKSLPHLDPSTPRHGYEEVKELEEADSTVKKLVSLEFADSHEVRQKHVEEVLSKIQDHPGDTSSLEAKVARLTMLVRNQMEHCMDFRKDKVGKSQLIRRIQARHKFLNKLRYADYERFEWLCQELKLKYIPHDVRHQKKLSKREKRLKVAHDQNKAIIESKMELFRQQLEKEKEIFMKEKELELEKIEQELKEMGVEETSSLLRIAEALKMGHGLIYEKPKQSRRSELLAMKFELYKDRKYKHLPEHMKDVFKKRDEQKERVTQFYRDFHKRNRDASNYRLGLLKNS